MAVGNGRFVLYPALRPPLPAGDWRLTATQNLTARAASGADVPPSTLRTEPRVTHVRVRSPQYLLPPDQILSTFPPAAREGSFGSRLPQIVIRRRTLPWERTVDPARPDDPWLALVVVAPGEASLDLNQPIGQCVTAGVTLPGPADAEVGNRLRIRQSMVHTIFPTQEELPLLAHAREVDLQDTELMMGDDDGFLSVVIANRLPLPAYDASGVAQRVTYAACLVNLCGQWDRLLDKAPPPAVTTYYPLALEPQVLAAAQWERTSAGRQGLNLDPDFGADTGIGVAPKSAAAGRTVVQEVRTTSSQRAGFTMADGYGEEISEGGRVVREDMAAPFREGLSVIIDALDEELWFPVLAHWSFTTVGDLTFEALMAGLDSGLLGTTPDPRHPHLPDPRPGQGRPIFEVVETGHVGLDHRTRRGDQVRTWYRGPFVPHPTADPADGRLPLAHTADQIRVMIPDGREDLSLAAAFEIGRLLALSRPSLLTAMAAWRQTGFQAAQRQARITAEAGLAEHLGALRVQPDRLWGQRVGGRLVETMVEQLEDVLGGPRPPVDPGRPVSTLGEVDTLLARGLGLPARSLLDAPDTVLQTLRDTPVRTPRLERTLPDIEAVRTLLTPALTTTFSRVSVQAVAPALREALDAGLRQGLTEGVAGDLGGGLEGTTPALTEVDAAVLTGVVERLLDDLSLSALPADLMPSLLPSLAGVGIFDAPQADFALGDAGGFRLDGPVTRGQPKSVPSEVRPDAPSDALDDLLARGGPLDEEDER